MIVIRWTIGDRGCTICDYIAALGFASRPKSRMLRHHAPHARHWTVILVAGSAQAGGLEMTIFDILHHREYRAAYGPDVRGQRGLPVWLSSAKAAMAGSGRAGTTETVDGRPRQLFMFCEAHNCGHVAAVMFVPYTGGPAKAAFSTASTTLGPPSNGAISYLGNPDEQERLALRAALDE